MTDTANGRPQRPAVVDAHRRADDVRPVGDGDRVLETLDRVPAKQDRSAAPGRQGGL
jgi:hypothetical protein